MIRRPINYLGSVLGNRRGLQRGGLTSLGYEHGGVVGNTTTGSVNPMEEEVVVDHTNIGNQNPHFIYTGQGIMSQFRNTPYAPDNPYADQYPDLVDLNFDGTINAQDLEIFRSETIGGGSYWSSSFSFD